MAYNTFPNDGTRLASPPARLGGCFPICGDFWVSRLVGMNEFCEWPVDLSCFPTIPEGREDAARVAVDTATEILWALTGRQFGVCRVEHQVGVEECVTCKPTLRDGVWRNIDVGGEDCVRVVLPPPVASVVSVVGADGEEMEFRQLGDSVVVVGGRPRTVVYDRGVVPPAHAGYMVGRLAAERFLQCVDPKRCQLPRYTTSVQRQGVSVQMANPAEVIARGLTGLVDVDTWIKAVNPEGLAEDSEVVG